MLLQPRLILAITMGSVTRSGGQHIIIIWLSSSKPQYRVVEMGDLVSFNKASHLIIITVHYSTVQNSTVQCSTVYSTVPVQSDTLTQVET